MKKLILLAAVVMIAGCAFGQKKLEKSPAKTDYEYTAAINAHYQKLYWALRTRVLSAKEMEEVESLGTWLIIGVCPPNELCSIPRDVDEQFNAALLQQFRLRIAAESLKAKEKPPCGGDLHPADAKAQPISLTFFDHPGKPEPPIVLKSLTVKVQ